MPHSLSPALSPPGAVRDDKMIRSFPVGRLRPPPDAPVDAARLRAVHRAVSELRRGTPVLLAGAEPLALLAVETVSARGVAELAALAAEPPVTLLAPARAAAVLRRRM